MAGESSGFPQRSQCSAFCFTGRFSRFPDRDSQAFPDRGKIRSSPGRIRRCCMTVEVQQQRFNDLSQIGVLDRLQWRPPAKRRQLFVNPCVGFFLKKIAKDCLRRRVFQQFGLCRIFLSPLRRHAPDLLKHIFCGLHQGFFVNDTEP